MPPFLLVHGAWHGAWCWSTVTPLLEAAGHRVFAAELSGPAQADAREIGLETHVRDVLRVLEDEDLSGVVFVAHSYAGVLAPMVLERRGDRIGHMVFLDPLLSRPGESVFDRYPRWSKRLQDMVRSSLESGAIAPPEDDDFGIADARQLRWVRERLQPQPCGTFAEPAAYRQAPCNLADCTFIQCIGDEPPPATPPAVAAGMDYRVLPTGHDAMITAPGALAAMLLDIAGAQANGKGTT